MEKEKKIIQIVQMSLHLLSNALNELLILNKEKRTNEEIRIFNNPPFSFYRISLQYLIIMEFTKLLEKDTKDNPRNIKNWESFENSNAASLAKSSRLIFEIRGIIFEDEHLKNKEQLQRIWSSPFYRNLKNDRNKKFGHSDGDYEASPYSIKTYSEIEINEAKSILSELGDIFRRCTGAFGDYEFHFDIVDNRTQNFVWNKIMHQEYFNKNFKDAISKGNYIQEFKKKFHF